MQVAIDGLETLRTSGAVVEKLGRPDNLDSMVILESQERRITAHDVVSIGGNRRFQEFVIVGIAANSSSKGNGFDHF